MTHSSWYTKHPLLSGTTKRMPRDMPDPCLDPDLLGELGPLAYSLTNMCTTRTTAFNSLGFNRCS